MTEHPASGLDIFKILLAGIQRERDRSGLNEHKNVQMLICVMMG
jgi:hypothetical protein